MSTFDDTFVTGCIENFHVENFRCTQWTKFRHFRSSVCASCVTGDEIVIYRVKYHLYHNIPFHMTIYVLMTARPFLHITHGRYQRGLLTIKYHNVVEIGVVVDEWLKILLNHKPPSNLAILLSDSLGVSCVHIFSQFVGVASMSKIPAQCWHVMECLYRWS